MKIRITVRHVALTFHFVEFCLATHITNKKIIYDISKGGLNPQIVKNIHHGYNLTRCINLAQMKFKINS